MSGTIESAKVKLVTIIAGEELLDGLEELLKAIGTSGWTVGRADGRGQHGPRRSGFIAFANVRIETLLRQADAQRLLERLVHAYSGRELLAFSQDVEAIPRGHFE
jgi:nitrogen regulatory protein PII